MVKEQKQELGWRVSVLPIPAFHRVVTSLYSFYAHAHETTPTSGYKRSHTHIVVEEGP